LVPGNDITLTTYRLNPALQVPSGTTLRNRTDYEQTFGGVELTLNKRLSNRWMGRASFSWNDWTQDLASQEACVNPNNVLSTPFGAFCPQSGEIVAARSAGSGAKAGIFIHSEWAVNVSGMYQLPLDFNIAANIFGRQGYPYPKWVFVNPDSGNPAGSSFGTRNIVVGHLDDERHEDIWTVDMRLEKVINLKPLTVAISADVFNVFNADYILQRNGRLNQSTFNRIDEVMAPRVLRLGARLTF
jgi:outer membrane receptor protein involved in Fe transport